MVDSLTPPGSTPRTQIHRLPEKAVHDREVAYAILDRGVVAQVAYLTDFGPMITPLAYARHGDRIVLHGSRASRALCVLASGVPSCVSVTLLDGLVLARSLFESSMHYRSVTVFGRACELEGELELDALKAFTERILPGRWEVARQPSVQERKATLTIALPLDEMSVKVSRAEPEDCAADFPDYADVWAGYVPLLRSWGSPVPEMPGVTGAMPWPVPGQQ